ncbi:hypothetical protein BKA69DRAFT_782594 [Paraphysoderma sedebokerense]|nr:hypothetical protein BKA69DRAFT_782594 [Paraphysoderma sedebokerense]
MHRFMTRPFQLSADFMSRGDVESATAGEHELEDGDIVIAASDGLFDNSYDSDIMETVKAVLQQHGSNGVDDVTMTRMAEALGTQAKSFMSQNDRLSPFAKGFQTFHQREYMGGKKDDVTIMAYRVVKK